MKKILDFLFYRYYKFQVQVANTDIAPFTSVLIIAAITMLYFFDFMFIMSAVFVNDAPTLNPSLMIFAVVFLIGFLYILLVYDGKYKLIIKKHEEEIQKKYSLLAILFPAMAFILFVIGIVIKIKQNQGSI